MTPRDIKVHRAILNALKAMPADILLPDDLLRADVARLVFPRPTLVEVDQQLLDCERDRHITGIYTDEGTKWKLADAGRAWLAEHP
jgi:hypothetical protein